MLIEVRTCEQLKRFWKANPGHQSDDDITGNRKRNEADRYDNCDVYKQATSDILIHCDKAPLNSKAEKALADNGVRFPVSRNRVEWAYYAARVRDGPDVAVVPVPSI